MFTPITKTFQKLGFNQVSGKIQVDKSYSTFFPTTTLKIDLENLKHTDIDVLIKELEHYKIVLKDEFDKAHKEANDLSKNS